MEQLELYRKTIESFDGTHKDHLLEESVIKTIHSLDCGTIRIAEVVDNEWVVNEWIKKAIILFFRIAPSKVGDGFFDKIPLKFNQWSANDFLIHGIRAVPGSIVRSGTFINKNVVIMNSFINIGAYIDSDTMIDSFATVGSCAQIGKKCHIAAGAVIGGVLEPISARPVIIEDHCLIGANASIVEGVIVHSGATVAMGTHIGASTKIIDRDTGNITQGEIPSGVVAVPGSYQTKNNISIQCVVISKKKTTQEMNKSFINKELRNHDE